MKQVLVRGTLAAAMAVGVCGAGGCATKTGTGAVIAGLGGAAVGAAVGSANGNAGKGALIGGAVGALGGAVVGNTMDHADKKQEQARADRARREEDERRSYHSRQREPEPDADEDSDADARADAAPRRGARPDSSANAQAEPGAAVTVDRVIEWWNDGETEEDILSRIGKSGAEFRLTRKDEERLYDEGVSDAIIKQMKGTETDQAAADPAPTDEPAPDAAPTEKAAVDDEPVGDQE